MLAEGLQKGFKLGKSLKDGLFRTPAILGKIAIRLTATWEKLAPSQGSSFRGCSYNYYPIVPLRSLRRTEDWQLYNVGTRSRGAKSLEL